MSAMNLGNATPVGTALAALLFGMFDAMAKPLTENVIYSEFANHLEHAACPIPCALVKAAEVASDMALKKEVSFKFE